MSTRQAAERKLPCDGFLWGGGGLPEPRPHRSLASALLVIQLEQVFRWAPEELHYRKTTKLCPVP